MTFNHSRNLAQLKKQHEQERVLLLSAGISDERIEELFKVDLRQHNRDRAFYIHIDLCIKPTDEAFTDDGKLEAGLHWLDKFENPVLASALKSLAQDEQEILNLHVNEQLPLTYVAAFLDKPYSTVQRRYSRVIKKLKKYFL